MTIDGMIHRQRVIVCRFSRESGRNGEGGKSHALSNKPTLYIQSSHSSSISVFVSVIFTDSSSNDNKRLQCAGLLWHKCCLVFVPTTEIYSCKMSQVTYTLTQSIVSAGALLARRQKMFC